MTNIVYAIKRRWKIFTILLLIFTIPFICYIYSKPLAYKAQAQLVFMGREGTFSPELESQRIKEDKFFNKAVRELIKPDKIQDVKEKLTLAQQKPNVLLVEHISGNPKLSRDVVNALSFAFVQEKQSAERDERAKLTKDLDAKKSNLLEIQDRVKTNKMDLEKLKVDSRPIDSERIALEKKYVQFKSNRAELLRKYTQNHPNVIAENEKIDNLESKLTKIPDNSDQYAQLQDVIERDSVLIKSLEEKYADSKSALDDIVEGSWTVDLAQKAELPSMPIEDNKFFMYSIVVLLSLSVALFLSSIIEGMDKTIYNKDEAQSKLNVPVQTVIPLFAQSRKKGLDRRNPVSKLKNRLIINYSNGASPSAYYDALYNSLKLKITSPRGEKKVIISGIKNCEGATLTACNLALCAAKNGNKTLLIDANIRRPSLHAVFGLDQNTYGLSDILAGSVLAKEATKNLTDLLISGALKLDENKLKGMDNLKILLSGSHVTEATALLTNKKLSSLIKELSQGYDFVIIDTPSLSDGPEALNLMLLADSVFLVARRLKSKYPSARNAITKINNVKAPFAGLVLNG
ncbi:AAA family ATPase [Candidatus Omnitrophota bacterium]